MTVYKPLKSPYYHYDFQRDGVRYHGSTGCLNRREADAYERRKRHEIANGRKAKEPVSLDTACGLYAEYAGTLPSWKTTKYMLRETLAGLGRSTLLPDIQQMDLQVHYAKRRAGRSNASINREIETYRAMWRHVASLKRFEVGEEPEWTRLMLKVADAPPRELSYPEEDSLFEGMRDDIVDVCDFALQSGWRLGEVVRLRWADCDLMAMQASTRIKGGDVIRRPLNAAMVAIIARQPKVNASVFTYVAVRTRSAFKDKKGRQQPGRKKGDRYPMTVTALRGPFAAAKKAGGVEGFRFHDFRHTRGTRLVRTTGNIAATMKALGHTNLKTTLRYAHVLDDDVRNALDASESRNSPGQVNRRQKKQ